MRVKHRARPERSSVSDPSGGRLWGTVNKETDIERDIAALRHMEKIRGELRGGKKLIRLW